MGHGLSGQSSLASYLIRSYSVKQCPLEVYILILFNQFNTFKMYLRLQAQLIGMFHPDCSYISLFQV